MSRLEARVKKVEDHSAVEKWELVRPKPGESDDDAIVRCGCADADRIIIWRNRVFYGPDDIREMEVRT